MGTFYNNAVCDIYMGKGAGAKLMQDIRNAKKNVKIVSPYLSPFLIKELIFLHSRGINIKLITSDEIEDFYGYEKNIHKLIIQNKHVDQKAKETRDNLESLSGTLLFAMIGLAVVLFPLMYLLKDLKFAFGFIIVILIFLLEILWLRKLKIPKSIITPINSYFLSRFLFRLIVEILLIKPLFIAKFTLLMMK